VQDDKPKRGVVTIKTDGEIKTWEGDISGATMEIEETHDPDVSGGFQSPTGIRTYTITVRVSVPL